MSTYPSYKTIKVKQKDNIFKITLNRPEKRNALNDLMVKELTDIFSAIKEEKSIRAVILSGAGKVFCSGADLAYLKDLKNFSYQENLQDSLNLSKLFLEIYTHPKPVIAIVHGAALAGGFGLASVCDFIIAETETIFGYPEVKIGFVAAMVSVFLIRQVGERKARELLLTGKILKANEVYQLGLITDVVKSGELEKNVYDLALTLINNSSLALAESKKILSKFVYNDIKNEIKFKRIRNSCLSGKRYPPG